MVCMMNEKMTESMKRYKRNDIFSISLEAGLITGNYLERVDKLYVNIIKHLLKLTKWMGKMLDSITRLWLTSKIR